MFRKRGAKQVASLTRGPRRFIPEHTKFLIYWSFYVLTAMSLMAAEHYLLRTATTYALPRSNVRKDEGLKKWRGVLVHMTVGQRADSGTAISDFYSQFSSS